jgi:hypothetical protein
MESHSALETIFLYLELMSGFISKLIHSNNTQKIYFFNSLIRKNLRSSPSFRVISFGGKLNSHIHTNQVVMKDYAIRNTDDTSRNVTSLHLPFQCHFV